HAIPSMGEHLSRRRIHRHAFVVGELSCGNLPARSRFLGLLDRLPALPTVSHTEAMQLLQSRRLAGTGLGWVDVHLLASTIVAGASLWTLDKPLAAAARLLGVGFER
ncbi:MAG TPA: hypothetical protein VF483_03555, partial [Gemmatimonadaceae bacterium]